MSSSKGGVQHATGGRHQLRGVAAGPRSTPARPRARRHALVAAGAPVYAREPVAVGLAPAYPAKMKSRLASPPVVNLAPELPAKSVCVVDPVCDFLLWALYRQDRFGVHPPPVPGEPITRRYGHFPQFAAARGARDPEAALALLLEYSREELARYDERAAALRSRITAALRAYPSFLAHWECAVKPLEEGLLDNWRDQLRTCEPLSLFQRLTRLPLGHDRLHLFACYYHPSGSALTPYPFLFTTLFNRFALEPSVAWFIGHEATHLLLDRSRWWERAAGRRGLKRYGSRYAAEEPLCFLLQNRLSSTCGLLPEEEMQRIDAGAAPNIPLYLWMQAQWDAYQEKPDRYPTIIDFFLDGLERVK